MMPPTPTRRLHDAPVPFPTRLAWRERVPIPKPRMGMIAPYLRGFLVALLLGCAASTGRAAPSRTIHNWTLRTPLGEFGWIEIGGNEFANERYFLFGQFAYFPTRASAPVVAIGASAVVATTGLVGFLLLRRRYAHKD